MATVAQQQLNKGQRVPREASPTTRKLFVLLHGAYGNQFLAKFHTGQLSDDEVNAGKDKGLLAAMLVWDADLKRFPENVVEAAARRALEQHPDYAPTLPQLLRICEAVMPRKTYAELSGLPRLPAPQHQRIDVSIERVGDGKDWARVIQARLAAGDKTVSHRAARNAAEALNKCKAAAAKTDEPVEVQQC
ncbi:hypothetical protein ACFIQF_22755 [Comamonas sp. J-3]|uniref:hypothetical protein n=1 Tax=Comamonas trifloxystrobinivorans TaxID=3350256 RepID=UPI003727CEE7